MSKAISAWFGDLNEPAAVSSGSVTGQLRYTRESDQPAQWTGQCQLADAVLQLDALTEPIQHFDGRFNFDPAALDISRFLGDGRQGGRPAGEYHYNAAAKRPERLKLELPAVDLMQIENAVGPVLHSDGILRGYADAVPFQPGSRRVTSDGDVVVDKFSIDDTELGPLRAHELWEGANAQLTAFQISCRKAFCGGRGAIALTG